MSEIFEIKGEQHYVQPMSYLNGNSVKCGMCYYFKPHQKPSRYWDGECTSVVRNTERGYTHRPDGNDYELKNGTACKWFFLPQDAMEQISFMKGENNE